MMPYRSALLIVKIDQTAMISHPSIMVVTYDTAQINITLAGRNYSQYSTIIMDVNKDCAFCEIWPCWGYWSAISRSFVDRMD